MNPGVCRDDLTVVDCLVLGGRQVADGAVESAVVTPVDPLQRGKLRGLCQISGHRWRRRNGFPLSPALRRGQLGDQRTLASEEGSSLLRQRDMALTAAADTEVLPQLIERRAEAGC